MKVELFDYDLPREMIAERPAAPRDAAKLLVLRGDAPEDRVVSDLPDLLLPGDVLVCNDTKVIPARLNGRRGTAGVQVTLHLQRALDRWAAFARPARKLKVGDRIDFAEGFSAEVTAKGEAGEVELHFNAAGAALLDLLHAHGRMPLPPYIESRRASGAGADERDRTDYQTLFAEREGAVAAPTAGLHFTPGLLARLEARGIRRVMLTLHVGAGTFLPVKVADTEAHRMHAEWGEITPAAAAAIAAAREAGGRLVAVGTTALRLLETAADATGKIQPFSGETRLFITPGYAFKAVELLLSNFHLPRSTLLMLVAAFVGRERILAAYEHAKTHGYRFYSYGDATLLWRAGR